MRRVLFAAAFLCSGVLFGTGMLQAATEPVKITAIRAIPPKATIGGEIRFLIQVERPKTFKIFPPSAKLKLDPFEIKNIQTLPPQGANRVRETFVLTLTAFKLGDLTIRPFPITYQAPSGKNDTVLTDPVPVKIVSVGKKKTDKEGEIRPIKGPVSYAMAMVRNVLLAVLALGLALSFLFRRRKKKEALDRESLLPPDKRAALELDRLKARNLLAERKEKEFYSGLSDVLRRYLERRYGIDALEKTTAEILADLKAKDLARALLDKMKEVLENADLVKFAKYEPPPSLAETLEKHLRDSLTESAPKPLPEKAK